MSMYIRGMMVMVLVFWVGIVCPAQFKTELKPETVQAFEAYVNVVEKTQEKQLAGKNFLWSAGQNESLRARIRSGEIVLHRMNEKTNIKDGMIHDWIGVVFLRDAQVEHVAHRLMEYDDHKKIYTEVIDSRLISRDGDVVHGYLKLKKKKVLTAVYNTEYEVRITRVRPDRWFLRAHSTKVAEVENLGEKDEHELPIGQDRGLMWRLNSYWSLEQMEDGVIAECRSITLSRSIPLGLGWMIRPYVESTPRETLDSVLEQTRTDVAKMVQPGN